MLLATIILSLMMAVVVLALIRLYGDVQDLVAQRAAVVDWPMAAKVGDPIGTGHGALLPATCFILLSFAPRDAYAAIVSTGYVAARWGLDFVLVTPSVTTAELHVDETVRQVGARHVEVSEDEFKALGLLTAHVLVFVRDGRVQDASANPSSPANVADRFATVAGPLAPFDPVDSTTEVVT